MLSCLFVFIHVYISLKFMNTKDKGFDVGDKGVWQGAARDSLKYR
jgi:hypothetical protein